jgi:hypothetical protein
MSPATSGGAEVFAQVILRRALTSLLHAFPAREVVKYVKVPVL